MCLSKLDWVFDRESCFLAVLSGYGTSLVILYIKLLPLTQSHEDHLK